MPYAPTTTATVQPANAKEAPPTDLLYRFLEAYWLRPENAFWMTLRSTTLARCPLEPPAIDLSCGDGVFIFLHAGGVFDPSFDVFTAVTALDQVRDEHRDMFDFVDESYDPPIVTPPATALDVGTDLKPALLAKARRLGVYHRLVEHDNNTPLPFDDGAFQTVYTNSAYWVENIAGFLAELRRITRPGGRIILQVKLDSLRRYNLTAHRNLLGDRFLDIIGRGRVECWPSLTGRDTWEDRFAAAGLSIESVTPFVTRTHAHVWDIGLRPLAPLLVKMANALTPATRAAIKQEWVDLFSDLLTPLCNPTLDLFPPHSPPAELQYLLTP